MVSKKYVAEANIGLVALVCKTSLTERGRWRFNSSLLHHLNVYNIRISIDLETDTFHCSYDCGNKGLREGILLDYIRTG